MNTPPSTSPPDPDALHNRVAAAVRSHRTKLRVLSSLAFLFGFLTLAASIFLVTFYFMLYLPKQKQILRDAQLAAQEARASPAIGEPSVQAAIKRIDEFLGVQILLNHVVSMGTTIIATVVGVLGLGTLVLLSVVILSRRATLNQIQASLAQISDQLRQLQTDHSTASPRPKPLT